MDEVTKTLISVVVGFILGVLSWLIKEVYERRINRRYLIESIGLELVNTYSYLKMEFPNLISVLHQDNERAVKINTFVCFTMYTQNIDRSIKAGYKLNEIICTTYQFLNYNKNSIIEKLRAGKGNEIEIELKNIRSLITNMLKSNRCFARYYKMLEE